jgi:Protein of unknown function (DUF3054)
MPAPAPRHAWPIAIGADAVAVLVFVAIGRASHQESTGAAGIWHTAWPFLLGAGLGLLVTAYARLTPTAVRAGVRVWVWTVVIGLVVRASTGGGTAAAFVVVAAVVLGVFVVGWRALLTWRTWRARGRRIWSRGAPSRRPG